MRGIFFLLILLLISCSQSYNKAPVVELRWRPVNSNQFIHHVKRGETLYAIAFRYDRDVKRLADYNHLRPPYSLRVGQVIRLYSSPRHSTYYVKSRKVHRLPIAKQPVIVSAKHRAKPVVKSYGTWIWPLKGTVVTHFNPEQGKKGIDIAGNKGEKVHAAAAGTVAYSGSGLSGYGNLIIIKHDKQYLTAYSNNLRNLVKEGQQIKAGQIIAEIGIVDRKFWGVHFEIRLAGQPINPLNYLH